MNSITKSIVNLKKMKRVTVDKGVVPAKDDDFAPFDHYNWYKNNECVKMTSKNRNYACS